MPEQFMEGSQPWALSLVPSGHFLRSWGPTMELALGGMVLATLRRSIFVH